MMTAWSPIALKTIMVLPRVRFCNAYALQHPSQLCLEYPMSHASAKWDCNISFWPGPLRRHLLSFYIPSYQFFLKEVINWNVSVVCRLSSILGGFLDGTRVYVCNKNQKPVLSGTAMLTTALRALPELMFLTFWQDASSRFMRRRSFYPLECVVNALQSLCVTELPRLLILDWHHKWIRIRHSIYWCCDALTACTRHLICQTVWNDSWLDQSGNVDARLILRFDDFLGLGFGIGNLRHWCIRPYSNAHCISGCINRGCFFSSYLQ